MENFKKLDNKGKTVVIAFHIFLISIFACFLLNPEIRLKAFYLILITYSLFSFIFGIVFKTWFYDFGARGWPKNPIMKVYYGKNARIYATFWFIITLIALYFMIKK